MGLNLLLSFYNFSDFTCQKDSFCSLKWNTNDWFWVDAAAHKNEIAQLTILSLDNEMM